LVTATSRHTSSDAHGTTNMIATKRSNRRGASAIESAGCHKMDQLLKMFKRIRYCMVAAVAAPHCLLFISTRPGF
jgi:hypothetical protein